MRNNNNAIVLLAVLTVLAVVFVWSIARHADERSDTAVSVRANSDIGALSTDPDAVRAGKRHVPNIDQSEEGLSSASMSLASATVIRTINEWGCPLTNIDIYRVVGEIKTHLGVTGKSGTLSLPDGISGNGLLIAQAKGYRSSSFAVDGLPPEGIVELSLHGVGAIRGRVNGPSGEVPPSQTRVFCWPAEAYPTARQLEQLVSAPPNLYVAPVASDGSFVIDGVDPRIAYTLAAGAPGYVSSAWVNAAQAGSNVYQLELWHLYAASVEFRSSDGMPIRTSPELLSTPEFYAEGFDTTAFLPPASMDLRFAGLQHSQLMDDSKIRSFCAIKSRENVADLGPVTVAWSAPGYAEAHWTVRIPRYVAALSDVVLALHPTASGWGRLLINPVGYYAIAATDNLRKSVFWIELQSVDGGSLRLPVRKLLDVTEFEGIPYGTYDISCDVRSAVYRIANQTEGQRIVIGASEALYNCNLVGLGAVQLSVTVPDGLSENRLTAYLVNVSTRERTYYHFDRPPYIFDAIMPGTYTLELRRLPWELQLKSTTPPFVVEADKVASIVFEWPSVP